MEAVPGGIPSLEAIESDLDDADRALTRLAEGSYADCEVCGERIGEDVLARSPLGRRCGRHSSAPQA